MIARTMAFRFTLQPALERARADEAAARARVASAARTSLRAQATFAACEGRVAESRRVPRVAGPAAAFAGCDGMAVAIAASLSAASASRDDARDVLERERAAYDAIARRRLALERLRERRLEAYRAREDVAESAESDERNAAVRGRPFGDSEACGVIALHRANGHPLVVNAELIETVECDDAATTIVTLTTGNVLAVTESPEDVRTLAIDYRRTVGRLGG